MLVKQIVLWFWWILGGTNFEVFSSLLIFIGGALTVLYIVQLKRTLALPPGPWGCPIRGYLPSMTGPTHLKFKKLAEDFGKIFSVSFGSDVIVVLSDYQKIREMFSKEEYTGRPHTDFMNIINGYGIINTEGALWSEQRKFLHDKLRKFGMMNSGMGRANMEKKIMSEVDMFLQELRMQKEEPTNISSPLAVAISNVICSLTMGVRFSNDDPKFKRFMDLIDEGFKLFGKLTYANHIPMLRYLPGINGIRNKISQNRAEMVEFFQQIIDDHRTYWKLNGTDGLIEKSDIRDIVDAYLYEIQEAEKEGREHELFQGKDKDRQMQQIMGDLFSAGMETVKNTLEWSMVFMLNYPEAAKAVQKELDEKVGRTRLPLLKDLPDLPITDATIQEILRRSTLVPLGTTHATTRDVLLDSYTLPAGTHVIPLLYKVHMDPTLWDEPEAFRPSRFLSADKTTVNKPKYFMPFGAGRRICLGETLARMEIFLFFSSMMHMFHLSLPKDASPPSLEGNVGITISAKSFEVCLQYRGLDQDCGSNGPLRNIGSH